MGDYISREAMHKANRDEWQGVYGFVDCDIFEDNENMIDRVPAADVRPVVRGKWQDGETIFFCGVEHTMPRVCSVCGRSALDKPWYFCPNCGADMREVGNNEN